MHLVELMPRKTGKQCLLRKAQQTKLEGMNILTGVRDPGHHQGITSGPETGLRHDPKEAMPEEIGMSHEEQICVTVDTNETDLLELPE